MQARPSPDPEVFGDFPRPHRDELAYSLLARLRAGMTGVGSLAVIQDAFGPDARNLRPCLPGNLRSLAAAIPGSVHTAAQLAQGHTVWPYHARLASTADHARVEAALMDGWPDTSYGGLGLFRGAVHRHRTLNCCPECLGEDSATGKPAGWRRAHQLPGVFVCAWHGLPLRSTTVSVLNQGHLTCTPADPAALPQVECPLKPGLARRIAVQGLWLLDNPGPPMRSDRVQAALRSMLAERGWMGANGMAKGGLRQAIADRNGTRALAAIGIPVTKSPSGNDPQRLWGSSGRIGCGTLGCLVLLDFLEVPFSVLVDAVAALDGPGAGRAAFARASANPRASYVSRHRSRMSAVLRTEPRAPRTRLRSVARTSYLYLQRNDPAWLEEALPPRQDARGPTVDWEARDAELSGRVLAAAAALLAASPPTRATASLIASSAGARTQILRADGRLPGTCRALAAAAETGDAYRRRRLRLAAEALADGTGQCNWAAFTRKAGFKECTYPGVADYARMLHGQLASNSVDNPPGGTRPESGKGVPNRCRAARPVRRPALPKPAAQ